jgi:hypothetical protein
MFPVLELDNTDLDRKISEIKIKIDESCDELINSVNIIRSNFKSNVDNYKYFYDK